MFDVLGINYLGGKNNPPNIIALTSQRANLWLRRIAMVVFPPHTLLLVTFLQSSFYNSIFKDAQLWQLWYERSHRSQYSVLVWGKLLLSLLSNTWSKINLWTNQHDSLQKLKCSANFRHRSEILLSNALLACAVLGFCLSLNFFPTKTRNTGLFKGRSLFASCLLLRQMFQGMREDINTCMGEERKKKKRCPGV